MNLHPNESILHPFLIYNHFLTNLTSIYAYKVIHIYFLGGIKQSNNGRVQNFNSIISCNFFASSYYSLTIYAYMSFILWLVFLTCVDELNTMRCQEALEVINYCCAFGPLLSFLDTVFIDISRTTQKMPSKIVSQKRWKALTKAFYVN